MSVLPCTSHCVASVTSATDIEVVAMDSVNYALANSEMKYWMDLNNEFLMCDRIKGKQKCTEW